MSSLTKPDSLAHGSVDIDETIMVSPITDQAPPVYDPLHLDETILVSSTTDLAATDNLSRLEKPSLMQDPSRLPTNHNSVRLRNTGMTPAIVPQVDAPRPHNLLGDVSSQNPDECLKAENEASKKIPETLESFTHFPKLPLELRRKVWNHALQVPEMFTVVLIKRRGYVDGGRPPGVKSPVGKSNIMFVNIEARNEAKMVLTQCVRDKSARLTPLEDEWSPYQQHSEIRGRVTWFNQNTDIAWLPDFDAWFCHGDGDGFPRNYGIERIAIHYSYWAQNPNKFPPGSSLELSYVEFGPKNLREIVLVVVAEDLRAKYGNERVTTSSKPADFLLHEAEGFPVADFTWDMMGKEEMRKMELWKKNVIAVRQAWIDEGWTHEQHLVKAIGLPANITVPDISFRLQVEALCFAN
ncbi:hypothetical protein ACEPPN_016023 [Leptodophora sp. 'Broadleaf-Isolate-01']